MPDPTLHDACTDVSTTESARIGFPAARLDRIALNEDGHFWHAPRRELLLTMIERIQGPHGAATGVLLDVGCGTGALLDILRQRGVDAHGVDPWADQFESGVSHRRRGQVESIPWPDHSVDVACAFDVLEHSDDVAGLAELFRILRPGGHLLLSVPAHQWLWSRRDDLAGHRRRYSRRTLSARVRHAGFQTGQLFGFQFLLLPLIAMSRLLARLRGADDTLAEDQPAKRINALLRGVNRLEISLGRWHRPPTGSSLLLVAQKPAQATDERGADG